jgi:hypothetical protein
MLPRLAVLRRPTSWIKVKSATWREANKNRGDLFDNGKRK